MGSLVEAGPTWRKLYQMKPEFQTPEIEGLKAIALRLGLRRPEIRLQTEHIRLSSALKVARLFQETMTEEGLNTLNIQDHAARG